MAALGMAALGLAALGLAALGLAATAAAQAPTPPHERPRPADAAALFRTLGAVTGLEATFEEQKQVALLALPLQSKGRLYFFRPDPKAPGWLARIVEAPERSQVTITPRELRLEHRDGVEVIDLQRSDRVRTFVSSLVHVFGGDEAALHRTYRVAYEPDPADAAAWQLTLTPREAPLDKLLQQLRFVGRGEAVERIEVHEPNGDRTTTRILTANPARRFDPAEQQRLFGIDAR
jgi:hypothetical protein